MSTAPTVTSRFPWSDLLTVLLTAIALIWLWTSPWLAPLKILIVLFHELSHALMTIITGGEVVSLELSSNQGGMVLSRGGSRFLILSAGYLGSLLMAGSYLAIGSCLSAVTKNQVIAFVLTITVSFLFTAGGSGVVVGLVQGWAPQAVVSAVQSLSFLNHFQNIAKGVIDLRDAVFFVALIAAWLAANVLVVDLKKAD